jgi:hypothetical protein
MTRQHITRISIVLIIIGFMISGFGVLAEGLAKVDWTALEAVFRFLPKN